MRPAHIHLLVSFKLCSVANRYLIRLQYQVMRDGYKPLTTQIFDSIDPYLENDSVFAVKDSLIVDFVPLKDNPKATLELVYDITLAPLGSIE